MKLDVMKTAYAKTLFSILLLLIVSLSNGCQQPAGQTAGSSDTMVTDKDADQQKLAGEDQASDDQEKSTEDNEDQSATENSKGGSDDGEQPLAKGGPASESANQNPSTEESSNNSDEANDEDEASTEPTIDIPATWKRLSKTEEIWMDATNKHVIVGGKICLDAGPLEMLICPGQTKAHESVVSVNAQSWQVHGALVVVGANPGKPCSWAPKYTPAWGPKIDIEVMWRDEETKQVKKIDGKQWILNINTQKPMTTDLVFGGSYSEPDVEGQPNRYRANDGELICLANFSTSAIDLHVSEENVDVFFEANTPLIPPINTQVYVVIKPGAVIGKPKE